MAQSSEKITVELDAEELSAVVAREDLIRLVNLRQPKTRRQLAVLVREWANSLDSERQTEEALTDLQKQVSI